MNVRTNIYMGNYNNMVDLDLCPVEYSNREYEAQNQFRDDLEEEFNMSEYPKKGEIWEQAWESGHSAGWVSVYEEYQAAVFEMWRNEGIPFVGMKVTCNGGYEGYIHDVCTGTLKGMVNVSLDSGMTCIGFSECNIVK